MNTRSLILMLLSFGTAVSPLCGAANDTAASPRYKLTVGQQLEYKTRSTARGESDGSRTVGQISLWVVRALPAGGWRIAASQEQTTLRRGRDDTRFAFEFFDLSPTGQVTRAKDASPLGTVDIGDVFIPLPDRDAMARGEWGNVDEHGDRFVLKPEAVKEAAAGELLFTRQGRGVTDEIYEIKRTSHCHFDVNRGLVTQVEGESSSRSFTGTSSLRLAGTTMIAPESIAAIERDGERLVATQQAMWKALSEHRGKRGDDAANATVSKMVEENQAQATVPAIKSQYAVLVHEWDAARAEMNSGAASAETLVNQPAPAWTTTDLDGKKHSLADYRGKVVVLDFWYRGCIWCVRAMPDIKKVVERYRDKPVVIFGMNTDRSDADATFVANKLSLNYTTLHAGDTPTDYHVSAFPTFVVIDTKGKIHDVHVGYSPDLAQIMEKAIDAAMQD